MLLRKMKKIVTSIISAPSQEMKRNYIQFIAFLCHF